MDMPDLDFEVTSIPVKAKPRRLKGKWTVESTTMILYERGDIVTYEDEMFEAIVVDEAKPEVILKDLQTGEKFKTDHWMFYHKATPDDIVKWRNENEV
jgi:hypothetical protein